MDRPLLTALLAMAAFLTEVPSLSLTELTRISAALVVGLGWTSTSEDQLALLGRPYTPVQCLHLYNGTQHPNNCERAARWAASSLVEIIRASAALSGCGRQTGVWGA